MSRELACYVTSLATLVALILHPAFAHAAAAPSDQALAAASQVVLTWSASSFHPALYPGRTFPSPKGPITVTAHVITSGKFADVSTRMITWYQNEDRIRSGAGLTKVNVTAREDARTNEVIRAEVSFGTSTVSQSVVIPVVNPSLVVEIPYPGAQVRGNSQVSLRAVPYFFNISSLNDLIFYWQIGEIKKNMGSVNSISLTLGALPGGAAQTVLVTSYVQSKRDLTNIIKIDTSLTVQ